MFTRSSLLPHTVTGPALLQNNEPAMTSARAIRLLVSFLAASTMLVALPGGGGSHPRYQSYMERGKQYFAAGNLAKASIEFRNALQIEPKSGDADYFNGQGAERRGELRDAIDFYQAAIDVQPKDNRARASLAKVFVLAGLTQRALEVI